MKRDEIRSLIGGHMREVGITRDAYTWVGTSLILVVEGRIFRFDLKAGMSKKRLAYERGRITAIAEFTGALAAASERRRARTGRNTNNAAITAA